jgi:hypothetical protein
MTETPGPIEAATLADLERGTAQGPFDAALSQLALRLARECDEAPTAAFAQRLRETLQLLAEQRAAAADSSELDELMTRPSDPRTG